MQARISRPTLGYYPSLPQIKRPKIASKWLRGVLWVTGILIFAGLPAGALAWWTYNIPNPNPIFNRYPSGNNAQFTNHPSDIQIITNSSQTQSSLNPTSPADNSSAANVTINGKTLALPSNGTTQQTIRSDDGKTTVKVYSKNSSFSSGGSNAQHRTFIDVNVSSHSRSTVNGR